ncbi:uncharacterized protein EAE98_008537 [Botrytis deweyae]|uniref:DNA2/NAM7 helicase-like C-terminal domain-containing protein n=1 Tax=Botrytis deweyae TaxID=2478750 RepID=A0ABQ7IEV1_9HELO|nr:uncharacterized protein EAE98_008537 [Botrytis deweyae]KAF7921690.1 hypothetical protein EAE98_008537 [Botrytis deweyae]
MSTLAEEDEEQNWAMAAWVHHPTKRSIHTTQLGTFSCSVHSCEKTVSATKVVHDVRDPSRLKFCITGGTDDPTIELRLSMYDAPNAAWRNLAISPSPNVIAMKFHLLPHTTHQAQIPKFERQMIRFNPMYSGVEFDQHQPIEGNTYGFSLEVASLTWQREISGPPAVLIEWQAEKNTMLNIDLGSVAQDHPFYEMSRDFIKIGELSGPVGYEFDRYSCIVPWSASLEYSFRYLLSTPQNKTAFWRVATNRNTLLATIPVTLRETHNLRLEEVWNLEAQRPNRFVKPTGGKRTPLKTRCDLRGVYEPHPVVCQFDSNMATEYYLKLPYILNIDAAAEQMSSTCDGYLRHKCIKARKYIPDASDDTVVFLAYIPIDGECDDGDIIFPLEGDLAKVVWTHKTSKDERPIVWQGKVLMSPSHHDRQWNVAMIAWIKDSTNDYEALLKRDFQPRFTFKSPETGTTTLLKFIDRILYGNPILNIRYRNWIKTFMMAQRNNRTMDIVDVGMNKTIAAQTAAGLNEDQLLAVHTMRTSPLCFIHGPPGTGKSDIAAKHAVDCAASGQRVVIIAQSNLAVAEILDKIVTFCDRFGLQDVKQAIVWNTADSGGEHDEEKAFSVGDALMKDDGIYDFTTEEGFVNTSVIASNVKKVSHPAAVKKVVMRDLERLKTDVWYGLKNSETLRDANKTDFMIGTDDATTSLLFDIHLVMQHIESLEKKNQVNSNRSPLDATAPSVILKKSHDAARDERIFDNMSIKYLKKKLAKLWQDAMYHYITHNTLILATTFGNLPSVLIRQFGAQHLIADEVCNATDMSFWGGMARFANTLKSGCGIGDPEQNGPFVAGGSRNYMRDQLSIDAMSRMTLAGMKPVRLTYQYRMHPDISALPIEFLYQETDATGNNYSVLRDDPSTFNRSERPLVKKWCSKYLNKKLHATKTSVFVSVEDGVLLRAQGSWSKTNHQNVVVVCDLVKSLLEEGIMAEDILVISFYGESVSLIRRFLKSQNIQNVDVEVPSVEVCSVDGSQGREKMVVIIESSSRCHFGDTPGFLRQSNRINVAMTRARECRIFVGHRLMCSTLNSKMRVTKALKLLKAIPKKHDAEGQLKVVRVGKRILDYENDLRPDAYVQVAKILPAMAMYDALR